MKNESAKEQKMRLPLDSAKWQLSSFVKVMPRLKLRRWGLVSASSILLLSGLAIGLTRLSSEGPNADSRSAVSILRVETTQVEPVESYQALQTYTGEVEAFRASELGFERSGKLVWLNVDHGDRVTTGTPIAKLDTSNLETKRLELLAGKAQAVAVLEELQAGPRTQKIAAARATVRDLEEQLKLEHIRRSRRKYLYAEGVISREQLDEVAFNANALSERLEAAKSNLDELLAGTRREQIAAQQAVVKQLEASIADIEITIAKSKIKAPFSGTIAARRLDEGTVVDAGQPVVRLVEDARPEVEIGVPVLVASQLKPGNRQSVQIGQRTYKAEVSSILPEVDPATRTRAVVVTLEQSAAQSVAPGQIARLKIRRTVPTAGYWLPIKALVPGERGLWSCYTLAEVENSQKESFSLSASVKKPYRVERQDVEVLHTESNRVLVRGAIQPGDTVIVDGTQRIVPGQMVRPADS